MSQDLSASVSASPESTDGTDPRSPSAADDEAENWWDFCPNCGSRLHNQGCKYRCPDCHYFMSCSDFDQ